MITVDSNTPRSVSIMASSAFLYQPWHWQMHHSSFAQYRFRMHISILQWIGRYRPQAWYHSISHGQRIKQWWNGLTDEFWLNGWPNPKLGKNMSALWNKLRDLRSSFAWVHPSYPMPQFTVMWLLLNLWHFQISPRQRYNKTPEETSVCWGPDLTLRTLSLGMPCCFRIFNIFLHLLTGLSAWYLY